MELIAMESSIIFLAYILLFLLTSLPVVDSNGRLIEPAMRSSLWRFDNRANINFNDHTLDCGGPQIQHQLNRGRCGVCGDPYSGVRDNEDGGFYASGIIARRYRSGSVVTMVVDILAAGGGYFEVKLCPRDDPQYLVTQECFDGFPLEIKNGQGTKLSVTGNRKSDHGLYKLEVQLPTGIACSRCVIQWHYRSARNYGVSPNGITCIGCGPQSDVFNCADVTIGYLGDAEASPGQPNDLSRGPLAERIRLYSHGPFGTGVSPIVVNSGLTGARSGYAGHEDFYKGDDDDDDNDDGYGRRRRPQGFPNMFKSFGDRDGFFGFHDLDLDDDDGGGLSYMLGHLLRSGGNYGEFRGQGWSQDQGHGNVIGLPGKNVPQNYYNDDFYEGEGDYEHHDDDVAHVTKVDSKPPNRGKLLDGLASLAANIGPGHGSESGYDQQHFDGTPDNRQKLLDGLASLVNKDPHENKGDDLYSLDNTHDSYQEVTHKEVYDDHSKDAFDLSYPDRASTGNKDKAYDKDDSYDDNVYDKDALYTSPIHQETPSHSPTEGYKDPGNHDHYEDHSETDKVPNFFHVDSGSYPSKADGYDNGNNNAVEGYDDSNNNNVDTYNDSPKNYGDPAAGYEEPPTEYLAPKTEPSHPENDYYTPTTEYHAPTTEATVPEIKYSVSPPEGTTTAPPKGDYYQPEEYHELPPGDNAVQGYKTPEKENHIFGQPTEYHELPPSGNNVPQYEPPEEENDIFRPTSHHIYDINNDPTPPLPHILANLGYINPSHSMWPGFSFGAGLYGPYSAAPSSLLYNNFQNNLPPSAALSAFSSSPSTAVTPVSGTAPFSWLPDPSALLAAGGATSQASNQYLSSVKSFTKTHPVLLCGRPELLICIATPSYRHIPNADLICTEKCRTGGACGEEYCTCACQRQLQCVHRTSFEKLGQGAWQGVPTSDDAQCTAQCNAGHCPNDTCACQVL